MLAPTTIFNTAVSFLTNTNLQHYSGEQHLSYFSQLVFVCGTCSSRRRSASAPWRPSSAACAATRTWATTTWTCGASSSTSSCRRSLLMGVLLMAAGVPMTLRRQGRGDHRRGGLDGHRRGRQAVAADDLPRPGGGDRPHQAPGDQRRRLLRRQLGAPLREPQCLDQLPDVSEHPDFPPIAGGDVRADGRQHAPRRRHLRRDDGAVPGDDRLGDLLGHAAAQSGTDRP